MKRKLLHLNEWLYHSHITVKSQIPKLNLKSFFFSGIMRLNDLTELVLTFLGKLNY